MRTTTVIIGAGHAGLAMSRCLTELGVEHVLLERGEVANSWRHERWDSLRLLTPNWQSRLPGYAYEGADPDGFRTMAETVDFLAGYAGRIDAPVHTGVTVEAVRYRHGRYQVDTTAGTWTCRTVVIATGACARANIPSFASELPDGVTSLSPLTYRNPQSLTPGGVLVVGASASGTQIADELARSGRDVTLAVGSHVRVPRRYRGRDIKWWMNAVGVLDERHWEVDDINRVRRLPSLQLGGTPDARDFDLNALRRRGVKFTGRLAAIREGKALFSGSLLNHCTMADLKLNRLLSSFDEWAVQTNACRHVEPSYRPESTIVDDAPPLSLNFAGEGITNVIWATGYRPDHDWLDVPVFDRKGALRHDGGVVEAPGLYAIGLPFLRKRKSTLIDGAADDARYLSRHLRLFLEATSSGASTWLGGEGVDGFANAMRAGSGGTASAPAPA